jgi:hypothetical protein
MTREQEIRQLIAKLRKAFDGGDNIELAEAISALEEATAHAKWDDEPPEPQPND